MKNILLVVSLTLTATPSLSADSDTLVRMKSGVSSPDQNSEVSHFTPIAADFVYRGLGAFGIGLEVMDTSAACRTYNILLGEDRRVGAALLLSPTDRPGL